MIDPLKKDRAYISTPEAAQRSGLSTNYIATLLRRGILEGFQLARERFVYIDSLEQYIAVPHKPGPKGPPQEAGRQPKTLPEQEHEKE